MRITEIYYQMRKEYRFHIVQRNRAKVRLKGKQKWWRQYKRRRFTEVGEMVP